MQQACEGWIGLLKFFQRENGCPDLGCVLRLGKFADLYTVITVREDEVDFRLIENNKLNEKLLIHDGERTEQILDEIELNLSHNCRILLHLIDQIEFNRPVPLRIYQLTGGFAGSDFEDLKKTAYNRGIYETIDLAKLVHESTQELHKRMRNSRIEQYKMMRDQNDRDREEMLSSSDAEE